MTGFAGLLFTSSTGAKLVFMPQARNCRPVNSALGLVPHVLRPHPKCSHRAPVLFARWVEAEPSVLECVQWPTGTLVARDQQQALVVAFVSDWALQYCVRSNPAITFRELA